MNREPSLDALRGLAIIGMVLSGSIAFGGVLPAWMYHAQVPPPLHQFDPTLPGITWVDLVFPFFLFSMGAAFPLALRATIDQQRSSMHFFGLAAKRFFMLAFFALFTQHLKAWVIAPAPGTKEQWYSLLAFLLLFGIFLNVPQKKYASYATWIKAGSFAVAVLLLTQLPFHNGTGFNLYKSDIILMVLANMAFFGSFIYAHTANRPLLRLLVLPAVAAIIVSSRENSSSWVKDFFYFNELAGYKFDWLYKFYFLKYLFIVIPGTLAGEWMMQPSWKQTGSLPLGTRLLYGGVVGSLLIGLLFLLLYRTHPVALRGGGVWVLYVTCGAILLKVVQEHSGAVTFRQMVQAGLFLLLMGLLLEPYEGGIKKDPSTFSYYFICSALAFLLLPLLLMLLEMRIIGRMLGFLSDVGKNPMLAYVAGALLILPILSLTGLKSYWESLTQTPLQGFGKGLLFTTAVVLITRFSVKKKWFWKT